MLIAMVDTLDMPTIFSADLQWPELAHLLSPEGNKFVNQSTVAVKNPVGIFVTVFKNLWIPSTRIFLVSQTIGIAPSGNI